MRSGINLPFPLLVVLLLVMSLRIVAARNAASSANRQASTSAAASSSAQLRPASESLKAGLHGPVQDCIWEQRTGGGNWRMVTEAKYDADGRVYQYSYTNNDGTKGLESFTYDADGHLLRTVWTGQAKPSDTIYSYDPQGRLASVRGQGDWTTTFEYDNQGRTTRIVKSTLDAASAVHRPKAGVSIERENADLFVAPSPGGWVTTLFNERDQPIESRAYGANGELLSSLNRTYDQKGRVLESTEVIESDDFLLSPAARDRLASDPKAFEEMERQFAAVLGPQRVLARMSYVYDAQGRVVEKKIKLGTSDNEVTKITYNAHGDEAEEIRTASHSGHPPEEDIVNFSYEYDSFGNWTEKKVSSPPTANPPSEIWTIEHRTITYY
jgi:YD repeat-containing protein